MTTYAIERFLFRLGVSSQTDRFVLKGAMLFRLWSEIDERLTRDLDLLGSGVDSTESVLEAIRLIGGVEAEDGLTFDADSWQAEEIRAADEYAGVRVRGVARLGSAQVAVQIDVGFGDSVYPKPKRESFPTLLAMPEPRVLAYPPEVVVAEKLETMLKLGAANSRMKDFFDIHLLSRRLAFDGATLSEAMRRTFERRRFEPPTRQPIALTAEFARLPGKDQQWRAFTRQSGVDTVVDLGELIPDLRDFLEPPLRAALSGDRLAASWPPGGPWAVLATE